MDPLIATILVTGWELGETDPRRSPADFVLQKPFDGLDGIRAMVARAISLHDERVDSSA